MEKVEDHMILFVCGIQDWKQQMNKINRLKDTDNNLVVTRGKAGKKEVDKGQGGQMYGWQKEI